jgi:hypothetical protein
LTRGPEQLAEKPSPLTEGDGARLGVEDVNCTHRWFLTSRFDRFDSSMQWSCDPSVVLRRPPYAGGTVV